MKRVRFLVVGGFLGAGKTTALLRLAARFQARGLRVGLITNDQAANLVDTGAARAGGFRVEEVAGACFCCKFDELAERAEKLRLEERPDVLIGEPVGSCTDLAATVVQPLRRLYADRYSIAPYSVLVDPTRARQIVLERGFGGFSPKVAYIFQKQLEEADLIGLNKVDLLPAPRRAELLAALAREFPRAKAVALSGLTGEGFDAWERELEADRPSGRNVAAVDYDVYAAGEAELGWLNLALDVTAGSPFDGCALALGLVESLRAALAGRAEIAHAKALFESEDGAAVASCTGAASPAALSRRLPLPAGRGRLVLNARVHLDPGALRATAEAVLAELLPRFGAAARLLDAAQFRPARPVPLHRVAAADAI